MRRNQTYHSSRLRITLRGDKYADLVELAKHSDRSVTDEARLLLEFAIGVMNRRLRRLYGNSERGDRVDRPAPNWLQMALADDEAGYLALDETFAQLRRRVGEIEAGTSEPAPGEDDPTP